MEKKYKVVAKRKVKAFPSLVGKKALSTLTTYELEATQRSKIFRTARKQAELERIRLAGRRSVTRKRKRKSELSLLPTPSKSFYEV